MLALCKVYLIFWNKLSFSINLIIQKDLNFEDGSFAFIILSQEL